MQPFLSEFLSWIQQYGSIAIFLWLALGIIALPIPEESLLLFVGFLMAKKKLAVFYTLIGVYAGTCCGITGSYGLGLFTSRYLVRGWGRYLGLTEKRFQRAQNWFKRFGKWALCMGYFIPGIRHLTGYVAGALKLRYKQFALFAYTGGIVWSSVFVSLGYFFYGPINTVINMLHLYTIKLLQKF